MHPRRQMSVAKLSRLIKRVLCTPARETGALHPRAKIRTASAILPRMAASFLFYKSHKSYKSYKSYFYQATGCTPGGKQASALAANERSEIEPPEIWVLCTPARDLGAMHPLIRRRFFLRRLFPDIRAIRFQPYWRRHGAAAGSASFRKGNWR